MASSNPQPAPLLDLAQFEGFTPGPLTVDTYDSGETFEIQQGNGSVVAAGLSRPDALLYAEAAALLTECRRLRAREIALMAREVDLITALTRIAESEPRPIASTRNRGLYRADVVEGLQRTARAALAGEQGVRG